MPFLFKARRGEEHPFCKIPNAERCECYRRHRDGEKITALAREKGVSPPTMHAIVHNPMWNKERGSVDNKASLGIDRSLEKETQSLQG